MTAGERFSAVTLIIQHQVHTMNTNAEMAAAVVAAWETDLVEAVLKVCEAYDCSLTELRAQLAAFEKEALA